MNYQGSFRWSELARLASRIADTGKLRSSPDSLDSFDGIVDMLQVSAQAYERVVQLNKEAAVEGSVSSVESSGAEASAAVKSLADSYYDLGTAYYRHAITIARAHGQVIAVE
jgi:hypothetical protein